MVVWPLAGETTGIAGLVKVCMRLTHVMQQGRTGDCLVVTHFTGDILPGTGHVNRTGEQGIWSNRTVDMEHQNSGYGVTEQGIWSNRIVDMVQQNSGYG